jgi:ABC-type nitrate/sulfonate/bicarbonate transport system permease component
MKKYLLKLLSGLRSLDLLIFLLILWEVFAGYIYPRFEPRAAIFLPRFSSVLKELWQLTANGVLWQHILSSLKRVMVGFSLASVCGVGLGFMMGFSRKASEQLEGLCKLLRPIPPVAWIPLSLLWFGITEKQQFFIIFIGAVFPILFNTLDGVQSVSSQYKKSAQALGVHKFLLLKKVVIPAALPKIMFGLRSGIGFCWFIIVAAEFVSAPRGLGYLILEGRNAIITERIFVGMIAIGVINLMFYFLLTKIENFVSPWQKLRVEE